MSEIPTYHRTCKISALQAKLKAESEYEKYRVIQDKVYLSDFDLLIREIEKK